MAGADERLARLEERVAALEGRPARAVAPAVEGDDPFFALHALQERLPPPGGVLYTGSVTLPDGGRADWQYGRTTADVLDADWSERAPALAALGHPVRLILLREIVRGRTTVNVLGELDGLGTSGQIYHHLRQLTAEGWLHSPSRGVYAVPPTRVVALLAVLVALER